MVILLWAALHYLVDATVLTRGLDRPVVVLIGDGGVAAAILVLILLLAAALVGALLAGRHDVTSGLVAVGVALALWTWPGGTIDEWLKMKHPDPGPATGAAYWPLLGEYAYWAVVLAALVTLTAWWHGRHADEPRASAGWRRTFGLELTSAGLRDGMITLVTTTVVAGVLMLVLTGPRAEHTYRGQVYFAVAVAFVIAVVVARRVGNVHGLVWHLPGPLIVGIVGVLRAGWRPALGGAYENINVIPAWGLVRPLPIEMVAVGLVAILLTWQATTRLSSEDRG